MLGRQLVRAVGRAAAPALVAAPATTTARRAAAPLLVRLLSTPSGSSKHNANSPVRGGLLVWVSVLVGYLCDTVAAHVCTHALPSLFCAIHTHTRPPTHLSLSPSVHTTTPPPQYTEGAHRSNAEELVAAFPIIEVEGTVALCDGGGGAMGHPIEYIQLNTVAGEVSECKYCGLRYKMKHHH